jgi:hypothetical protein
MYAVSRYLTGPKTTSAFFAHEKKSFQKSGLFEKNPISQPARTDKNLFILTYEDLSILDTDFSQPTSLFSLTVYLLFYATLFRLFSTVLQLAYLKSNLFGKPGFLVCRN